jgi:TetR/AcrR family transcriptional repressor of nem operon
MSRPREFDEGTALAAIRNTFWDHGYAATSVDDLVRATGLGKGSLYGAFGSKREMFVRALREYAKQDWNMRSGCFEMTALAGSKRGCLLAKAIAELAGEDGDVDGIVGDFYRRYEELFVRTLRRPRSSAYEIRVSPAENIPEIVHRRNARASCCYTTISAWQILRLPRRA